MITITEANLRDFLARRPAPAFGPSFTLGSGVASALAATLGRPSSPDADFYQLILDAKPTVEALQGFLDGRPAPGAVARWADTTWPAILSLTPDSRFDPLFRVHQDKNPGWHPAQTIENLTDRISDRTVPIFRLLGTIGRSTGALSRAVYLQRRAAWRFALQAFAATTRGSPLLLVGFEDAPSLLLDLLSEFQAVRSLQPQAFCLFASDPLVTKNPSVLEVVEGLGKTVLIDCPMETFVNRASTASSAPAAAPPTVPILDLKSLSEYVVVVNDRLKASAGSHELNRLLDLLSSPASADWDPIAHGLDLPRTANEIVADLRSIVSAPDFRSQAFIVSGAAATGKTILLKRAAYDLAQANKHVLWLRAIYASDAPDVLRTVFRNLAGLTRRAVVVMDDPLAFPSLTPADVAHAARLAQVSVLLIVGVRTTDRHFTNENQLAGGLAIAGEYEFPAELDSTELELLPPYLAHKLKLAPDEAKARQLLPIPATSDALALLYLLLPQTRPYIQKSLSDEYFRLGNTAALIPIVRGAYESGGAMLQHAYRLVAVATHYRAPLPLEVLVQALGVSYSDWLDAASPSSPAWGLLYPDQEDQTETISYRTRNALVADELRKIVNGGVTNRKGEVECLSELLAACTGTQSLYREFCIKILVSNPSLDELDFDDGKRLFDVALAALPFRDRTLLHHKARWIRRKGPEIMDAFPVLDEALATAQNPFNKEQDEHLHTTYARTILKAFERDKVSLDAAKVGISEHLEKASSDAFMNLHATHVRVETALEFVGRLPPGDFVDRASLTAQALAEVARTLVILQYGGEVVELGKPGDVQLLEVAQSKLLATVNYDADDQWQKFKSQSGFVANARKLLEMARTREKGTDYNAAWDYVQRAIKTVSESATPSMQLHEIATLIYYRWRIQRFSKKSAEKIDWPRFREHVEGALRGRDARRSSLFQYLLAVTLCHQDKWPEASAIFQKLRTSDLPPGVIWLSRDYLLSPDGSLRRVQGRVKPGPSSNMYFVSSEVGFDCRADRKGPWPMSDTAEVHAHIRFSYGGPMAFREL